MNMQTSVEIARNPERLIDQVNRNLGRLVDMKMRVEQLLLAISGKEPPNAGEEPTGPICCMADDVARQAYLLDAALKTVMAIQDVIGG